ncbi:hypothetical protein QBC42DRAFT_293947 [Cladorrhinum samala]|uniref:FAD/NAD(P)-binding domain-containing protein n=1 Tax=Cladorrhinum samala TaxID=585594 RepID=A0AAV9I142_9PEZI|nr:hypothetical protein QBC42DRAFT_293947 [Cladorrhinum samala]
MATCCEDCSAAADLREELEKHPLPSIAAATIDSRVMTAQETTKQAQAVLIHDGAPPSHTGHLTGGMFSTRPTLEITSATACSSGAGGHCFDVGGVKAIVEEGGGIGEEEADAVVWCIGFADANGKHKAKEVLGFDDTFGFDIEGEIRGMWKRQARMDNYWCMGGSAQASLLSLQDGGAANQGRAGRQIAACLQRYSPRF